MRSYMDYRIIGVDAGYGNMKTANSIYPTGLVAMDTKPYFEGDIMEFGGRWYRIGEGHKAYNPDKTSDEEFYILTLASVACELRWYGLRDANVHLALGLPTTWTGRQRDAYRDYMLRKRDVSFVFNDIVYQIHFVDCSVFPQGYAALVPIMDSDKKFNGFRNFMGTVMMADIGNGTMNIMQLQNGRPDDKHCWTEVLGVNQCALVAKKQLMDKYGIELPDEVIEDFLRTGQTGLRGEYADQLRDIVRGYVTRLFDSLRSHGYDSRLMKLYVFGGGGCLMKNFGTYDRDSVIFIDDLNASAKGYEYLAQGKLWAEERARK